jgi:hypothetical protein
MIRLGALFGSIGAFQFSVFRSMFPSMNTAVYVVFAITYMLIASRRLSVLPIGRPAGALLGAILDPLKTSRKMLKCAKREIRSTTHCGVQDGFKPMAFKGERCNNSDQ